ncbi:hypothetical protein OPU71_15105 [Niveibacterium sp. 24ML]|uniref:hypothetical protein n=1 Tax=Niveibacterium sp. 24ML TaxID=2985512 RepID=UPI002271AEA6|nr:hypothetical protein [Niveibacterium sp. 24ML]MCX9157455.1 hypothetical protein [Niveibacterium sp. 24ML]
MPDNATPILISVELRSVDALLAVEGSALLEKRIDDATAFRLYEGAYPLPRRAPLRIELIVDPADLSREATVCAALRGHFELDYAARTRELARLFAAARTATAVGLVFVVILLAIANAIDAESPSQLARGIRESFTIFAWVAMWRPAELWLYEHWPIRRRRALARRLAAAPVKLVPRAAVVGLA